MHIRIANPDIIYNIHQRKNGAYKRINTIQKKHNITKRDARNFNEEVFLTEIKQINWDDIQQCEKEYRNHSFNSLNDTIEKLLDKHMPKRTITKK